MQEGGEGEEGPTSAKLKAFRQKKREVQNVLFIPSA
jgi:hypothetical protein